MKKFLLLLILTGFLQIHAADKARGIFLAVGVGPRLPVSSFAVSTDLGYGFNVEISYTDNEYLPVFLYGRVGYEQYPGSQDFYQATAYSNYATTSIPLQLGARYYFPPLLERIVLFIPVFEAGISFSQYVILNEFKPSSGRSNFTDENSKLGFHVGMGISMFMLEIMSYYNYYQTNQFVSLDLKVRLPLYINI